MSYLDISTPFKSLNSLQVLQRDLSDPFSGMYLEDVIFWLSTCLLTFGIIATAIYDYILTEVQTGGFIYALISLPVLWYAGLEIIFPKESRKAYMMLMVNEYLKAYVLINSYFFVFYLGSFNCDSYLTDPKYTWLDNIYGYMCQTIPQ